ncbi:MAG: sugar ABC transporter permease, partial [Kocuria sp.]|nr:sugar ABC transporter permease [Kocuria sp.]
MTEATLRSSPSARSSAPNGARPAPRRRSRDLIGLLYIAPVMLVLLVVLILPALFAVVYSLLELKSVRPVGFAGLENYREVFSDPAMAAVLVRTLVFAVITVALTLAVALAVAVFLDRLTASRALVVQILVILPWVISTIVGALLFRWFFVTDISPGVYLLSQLGIEAKPLTDPTLSMISLIVVAMWRTLGFAVLLLLAGLKTVPSEFYEAATMDGANSWQQFRLITLPMIKTSLTITTVVLTMS